MSRSWFSVLFIGSLMLVGCNMHNRLPSGQISKVDSLASPDARLAALVQLDQEYHSDFAVKYRLGELYLQFNQLKVASVYLREAMLLRDQSGVTKQEGEIALLEYARTLILLGNGPEAVKVVAPLARQGNPTALLTRARAHVEAGDAAAAAKDFSTVWAAKAAHPAAGDYTLYAEALATEKKYSDALYILRSGEQQFGYQPGTGFLKSTLQEKAGDTIESILSAFEETEYQRVQGRISLDQVEKNLSALAVRSDVSGMVSTQAQMLIRGLKSYLRSQWGDALHDFNQSLAKLDSSFARYLILSATFETGLVTAKLLGEYVALEPQLRTYPDFYNHLWRAMSRGPGTYTLENARPVLEKAIVLAPSSEEAIESRIELGRLIGLDAEDARKLLLGPELNVVYGSLVAGADPGQVLKPVLDLLTISKENIYSSAGVLMLKSAAGIPAVRTYLSTVEHSATGVLRQRVAEAL